MHIDIHVEAAESCGRYQKPLHYNLIIEHGCKFELWLNQR
jgi:hypothetical protein